MAKGRFRIGDRVIHDYHGSGVITGMDESRGYPFELYFIEWDEKNYVNKIDKSPVGEYSLRIDKKWLNRKNKIDKLID